MIVLAGRSLQWTMVAAALATTSLPAGAQPVSPPPLAATLPAPSAAGTASGPARPRPRHAPGDPLEGFNRAMFSVNGLLDRILFRPASRVYKAVIPRIVRTGIRHVFSNLGEPVVFLNDVVQLRPRRAVRTFGRFVINSTLGVGGVIDVARGEGLPHRGNGFGNTLGRYGVRPGPYLFLPLAGPSDLRDLAGGGADGAVLPLTIGTPFDRSYYVIPQTVLTGLDQRVAADADLHALLAGAADPYATLRSVYLQSRAAAVAETRGRSAIDGADNPPVVPATPGAPPPPDVFDSTPADPAAAAPVTADPPADPAPDA